MLISKSARDRVFAAADTLYLQMERASFPTVDAVRREARVSMNDASLGMKEWRRAQTVQNVPAMAQIPELVQRAHAAALLPIWQAAQEQANEALHVAKAGWDAERAEAEALNKQVGDAYEAQAEELKKANELIERMRQKMVEYEKEGGVLRLELDNCKTRAEEAGKSYKESQRQFDMAILDAKKARDEAAELRGKVAGLEQALSALNSGHPEKQARKWS